MKIIVIVGIMLVIIPGHFFADTPYIAKDPDLAERIGFYTGVCSPLILSFLGLYAWSSVPVSPETSISFAYGFGALGFSIPPLGNIYAGRINVPVAILFGSSIICYSGAMISYFSEGLTTRRPSVFEFALIAVGVVLRITAGFWDWLTAREETIRMNKENGY